MSWWASLASVRLRPRLVGCCFPSAGRLEQLSHRVGSAQRKPSRRWLRLTGMRQVVLRLRQERRHFLQKRPLLAFSQDAGGARRRGRVEKLEKIFVLRDAGVSSRALSPECYCTALKTAYVLRRWVVDIRFGSVCWAWADLRENTVAVFAGVKGGGAEIWELRRPSGADKRLCSRGRFERSRASESVAVQ